VESSYQLTIKKQATKNSLTQPMGVGSNLNSGFYFLNILFSISTHVSHVESHDVVHKAFRGKEKQKQKAALHVVIQCFFVVFVVEL